MIVQRFQLIFDNPYATYYGGQVVTGRLVMKLIIPTRVRGIELVFRGEAKVEWTENTQQRDSEGHMQTCRDNFCANEMYFENRIFILGGAMSDMLLQPGDHMYSFTMQLPAVLPSSFEGRYGSVRYSLTATLECLGQNSHVAKVFFTVLNQLDLNQVLAVKDPIQIVEDKYLCCCCCKSGPITVVVSLPASGFAPGQQIPFTVEVDNITNKPLSTVMCTLNKVVVFTAMRPTKKSRANTEKVAHLVLGGVDANDSHTWTEKLLVPTLPPSMLQHCSIIDITYCLIIEVKIPGMHQNMSVSVPITIGTIPLYANVPRPIGTSVPPQAPMVQGELPPPTYEECTYGQNRPEAGGMNQVVFLPRYPTYHF